MPIIVIDCPGCGHRSAVKISIKQIPQEGTRGNLRSDGVSARTNAKAPSRAKGRPRLGEVRDKPWEKTKPPMSKATWYRRRKETLQGAN
jgi:hypothetical protein